MMHPQLEGSMAVPLVLQALVHHTSSWTTSLLQYYFYVPKYAKGKKIIMLITGQTPLNDIMFAVMVFAADDNCFSY